MSNIRTKLNLFVFNVLIIDNNLIVCNLYAYAKILNPYS